MATLFVTRFAPSHFLFVTPRETTDHPDNAQTRRWEPEVDEGTATQHGLLAEGPQDAAPRASRGPGSQTLRPLGHGTSRSEAHGSAAPAPLSSLGETLGAALGNTDPSRSSLG